MRLLAPRSQPKRPLALADHAAQLVAGYALGGKWWSAQAAQFINPRGFFDAAETQFGTALEPNTNGRTFSMGAAAAVPVYEALLVFDLRIANLTSETTATQLLADTQDPGGTATPAIAGGSVTSFISGEVLTILGPSGGRTAITTSIPIGLHKLLIAWNGGEYTFRVDDTDVATTHGSGGAATFTSLGCHLGGRVNSGTARFCPILAAVNPTPEPILARASVNPWQIFKPHRARIYSFPTGGEPAAHTLTGAVTLSLTPAASFDLDQQHTISGAVAHTLAIAASLDADFTDALSGAVTLSMTPAATMAFGAENTLAGAVSFALTPAATLDADFTQSLAGAVTFSLTPTAGFDLDLAHSLAGAVTLTLTPAATFDLDLSHAISGAVTYPLTIAASMTFTGAGTDAIAGDVTFTLTPAASFDLDQTHALSGAVSFGLSVSAAFDLDRTHSLTGAVALSVTPAATMLFTPASNELAGAVSFTMVPAATMDIDRQHSITGSVPLTLTPAAVMDASLEQAITGSVLFQLAVAGQMTLFDPISRVWRIYATVPDERTQETTVQHETAEHTTISADESMTVVTGI